MHTLVNHHCFKSDGCQHVNISLYSMSQHILLKETWNGMNPHSTLTALVGKGQGSNMADKSFDLLYLTLMQLRTDEGS